MCPIWRMWGLVRRASHDAKAVVVEEAAVDGEDAHEEHHVAAVVGEAGELVHPLLAPELALE